MSKEQEESKNKSDFVLTKGIPTKNSSKKLEWNDNDLRNAKSVKESMDAVNGFCGLMAGFEGFIINEYVKKNQNSNDDDDNTMMMT